MPTPARLRIMPSVGALCVCAAMGGHAGALEPLYFKVGPGSVLMDECLFCDRAPIEVDVAGTFLLAVEETAPGNVAYRLSELALTGSRFEEAYQVTGEGRYARMSEGGLTQEVSLTVEINGACCIGGLGGIVLAVTAEEIAASWPALDVRARETGERDPMHVYSLRLVAEPPVARPVTYRLEEGSVFVDDCLCRRPLHPVPLTGTFRLGPVEGHPLYPFAFFRRLDNLDLQGTADGESWRITGGGHYLIGGEFAWVQEMELEVQANDERGAFLASGRLTGGSLFPRIEIDVAQKNHTSILHIITLHLVAAPADPGAPFRRGDANDDGRVDLSDPLAILFGLFAGEPMPDCREALDANGDRRLDVADPLSLLRYFFQGGEPPPSPGPDACGEPPDEVLGCRKFGSC